MYLADNQVDQSFTDWFHCVALCFCVQVISGQNLPKPGSKKGEIIDPYVVLQVTGVNDDKKEQKTKPVNDNGEYSSVVVVVVVGLMMMLIVMVLDNYSELICSHVVDDVAC